ncbi:DNA glycosylase [Daldinia decipiens]|uniref:DNA glycosylase n=1 Tax=Daldinia decipiens TaxID=326647 RepID=UPI0020C4095D|nr:DNA glycosylase [Daldinia decipiens]KAI1654178.1 DNA glycosylase [Daldinia decipiens]
MGRSLRSTRQSVSILADEANTTELLSVIKDEELLKTNSPSRKTRIRKRSAQHQSDEEFVEDSPEEAPRIKRQKVGARASKKSGDATAQLYACLFGKANMALNGSTTEGTCINLLSRAHGLCYHRPLLLDSRQARTSLLTWFDGVSSSREMPWRKPWTDPSATTLKEVERRAYQVWISEIMLQQTRVATVVDYWNRWMERWPTIQDLAAAEQDEVLSAWRGLGYYSRATRIHDAARIVCKDSSMKGLLPADVGELVAKVPGVGRYTAGAISAIVFGRAAPMVDGNVLRVLSRQLGVFGDVKADKAVIELLWAAADSLVKAIAGDDAEDGDNVDPDATTKREENREATPSNRPGRWGQALMELGSTICAPKPNCAVCPITSSCRAYDEGIRLATKRGLISKPTTPSNATLDIEDACIICKPFKEYAEEDADNEQGVKTEEGPKQQKSRSRTQTTLRSFAFTQVTSKREMASSPKPLPSPILSSAAVEAIVSHARKFPLKTVKKAVREEETLVCAIRRSDGRYLIHKRPEKGLLAGLWELPSYIVKDRQGGSAKARKRDAEKFVQGLISESGKARKRKVVVKHVDELGSVPWLFSHLKLTMHVHLFELVGEGEGESESEGEFGNEEKPKEDEGTRRRWRDVEAIDAESMGTGMRKCWALVKGAD